MELFDEDDLTDPQRMVWQQVRGQLRTAFGLGVAECYLRQAWHGVMERHASGPKRADFPHTLEKLAANIGDRPKGTVSKWFGKNLLQDWLAPTGETWANLLVVLTEVNRRLGLQQDDWEAFPLPNFALRQRYGWRNALFEAVAVRSDLATAGILAGRPAASKHPTVRPAVEDVDHLSHLFADLGWVAGRRGSGRPGLLARLAGRLRVSVGDLDRLDQSWGDPWVLCVQGGLANIRWS